MHQSRNFTTLRNTIPGQHGFNKLSTRADPASKLPFQSPIVRGRWEVAAVFPSELAQPGCFVAKDQATRVGAYEPMTASSFREASRRSRSLTMA